MQVILQGSLRHFPLGKLLALIAEHAHSGTLELDEKPHRARLVLMDRKLAWIESSEDGDPRSMLRQAATWTSGTFRLLEEPIEPDGGKRLDLALEPIIEELDKLRAQAAVFGDDAVFQVIDDSPAFEEVTLKPEELKLILGVGKGKSFGTLAEGRDRSDLSRTIRRLVELGLLSPAAGAAGASPDEPAEAEKTLAAPKREVFDMSGSLTSTASDALAYALIEDEQTIGRDEANAVAIPDGSVSSKHAKIIRGADGFYIEDLGSRNGTFVNGEKVTERRLLTDNDVIRFGKVVFTFNVARELVRGRTTAQHLRP